MTPQEEVDYKAEVLKVYPDAECWTLNTSKPSGVKQILNIQHNPRRIGIPIILGQADTEPLAWQNAYTRLKESK